MNMEMRLNILFISLLSVLILVPCITFSQDCDENMLMFDCDGQYFCNNEPGFGFDCYVYNEYCEDFNGDGITDAWVGDGWCDDGEWGYDFQCAEYSFDCGDCGDVYTDYNGYCSYLPQEFTFMYEGETRQYILYIPESLPPNAPLIFLMHGFTGSATGMYNYSGMQSVADENGFAVCYPDGTIDQNGDRFWNVGYSFHQNQTVDDVGFLSTLAVHLQNEYNLSPENTFASGMSNGAEMSYMLACFAGDKFGAIAPVAGTMFGESWTDCSTEPIPVLEIHGTNDNVTLWDGDLTDNYWGPYPGMDEVIEFWVGQNECVNSENNFLLGMNTIHHRYFNCANNNEVWLYEVVNGGHDWPNYSSQEIWNFFANYIVLSNGDLNYDDSVDILDVIILVNHILSPSTVELEGADINNDGEVNVLDVVALVNIILGN